MSKSKVLHDPIAYKQRKNSFTFNSPRKERTTTGRFMPAGSDYGTGFNNPVGKEKCGSMASGPIPQESVCFPSSEAIR